MKFSNKIILHIKPEMREMVLSLLEMDETF